MNVTSRRNAVTDAVRSTAANDVDLDPIFAAIEAHRRAEAEFSAALGRLSDLENELPEERRRSEIKMELSSQLFCRMTPFGSSSRGPC